MKIKTVFQKGIKVLIAGLITAVLLWLCSNIYYKNQYFELTFKTKQDKEIVYQVFYTTEKGQVFDGKQSVQKKSPAGKHSERIVLPISKIEQFRLDFGVYPGQVTVWDMVLKGKTVHSFDFNDFRFVRINSQNIQGNQLTIVSNENDPLMIYKKNLQMEPLNAIDWCFFFGLLCIFGAVFYALVSYLSTFKIFALHSLIDIIFVCLFFGSLFLPMMHLSKDQTSHWENRILATKPKLFIENGKINNDYGKKLNEWFSDRFWGRETLLSFHSRLNHLIAPHKGNEKVLVGKDGWLFYDDKVGPLGYANAVIYSDAELSHGFEYIEKLYRWCQQNGKKFYYMIVPDKNKVYGEYYQSVNKINDDSKGYAAQFVSYLKKRSDVPVFYLRDYLLGKKSKGLLYYKRDTHWNKLGAYQGYLFLTEQLKKDWDIDFLTVSNWEKVTEVRADLSDFYHQEHINDAVYLKPILPEQQCTVKPANGFPRGYVRCENKNGKYRVFVLRDSMFDNLLPYFAPNFEVVEMHWKRNMTSDDLRRIKTEFDIVFIENAERATWGVMRQSFPEIENH